MPARRWTLEMLAAQVGRVALGAGRALPRISSGSRRCSTSRAGACSSRRGSLAQPGPHKVAAVAEAVGYESEAAFSRAFKKSVGVAPAAWRLQPVFRNPPPLR
jgi:AraC-like DNA-binding protein